MLVTAVRNLIENAITYSDDNSQVGIGLAFSQNIAEIAVTATMDAASVSAGASVVATEITVPVAMDAAAATGSPGEGLAPRLHVF